MMSVARRFGRFSLVGLMGAIVQLLVVWLLTKYFGIPSVVASAVAVEIAILHNFIWHERFTWSDREPKGSRQLAHKGCAGTLRANQQAARALRFAGCYLGALRLWRFHAGNGLISLSGNTILMYCLVERLKAPTVPAAIAGIALCSLANFFFADRWVYTSLSSATLPGPVLTTGRSLPTVTRRTEGASAG